MRLLHVSDLHFGRGLGEVSREAEQRALVSEIVLLARDVEPAITVISGDVYDAYTPPAWAEDLFFTLLDGLADGGRRAVAVIAGNHDSGARIAAADPLARRLGIVLAGEPGAPIVGFSGAEDRVRVEPVGPQVARIEVPGAPRPIALSLLPFLSEARVAREDVRDRQGREASLPEGVTLPDGATEASRYAARLAGDIAARAAVRVPRAYHVLAMHQYVTGGVPTDSERRLRVGAISDLDAAAIPAGFDYVALGHLHRPQEVVGAGSRALYAGSPIAYSFSEAGQEKRAVVVHLGEDRVESVALRSGRPLEVWRVGSVDEARALAERASNRALVDVRVAVGGAEGDASRRLAALETEALFALPNVSVVSVRDLFVAPEAAAFDLEEPGVDLPVEELIHELWRRRLGGEPDAADVAELMSAVLEVGRGEGAK